MCRAGGLDQAPLAWNAPIWVEPGKLPTLGSELNATSNSQPSPDSRPKQSVAILHQPAYI